MVIVVLNCLQYKLSKFKIMTILLIQTFHPLLKTETLQRIQTDWHQSFHSQSLQNFSDIQTQSSCTIIIKTAHYHSPNSQNTSLYRKHSIFHVHFHSGNTTNQPIHQFTSEKTRNIMTLSFHTICIAVLRQASNQPLHRFGALVSSLLCGNCLDFCELW